MIRNNFTEVEPLCYWVQHILPLVYDDSLSYMELLGRVTKKLNELIVNNNKLPDFIAELIKDYISSGAIEKVLAEVLADYMLNVKFPPAGLTPATGDGSADDTKAIQGCIDYAYNNGGMSVYFPSGSYLTQPLTLRDKAILFGQDRYTTRLVMKGGATTAMFTGDVDELTLTGLGFDGNMDIQVNNVNLFTISVNSAIITNCLLTDGYDLLNITVNDDLQLNDVIFRHAVENALVLKGEGIVQGNNLIFKSVSALVGKNFVVMDVSKSILEQLKCYGASPNAVLINGSNNVVKMWNEQSLKAYTDNGANNTVEVYTQSEQKKLTGFKTTDIKGDLTETIGGNKTESITGNKGVSVHDLTETVAGNHTKTVTGDISESANRLTEQLTNKEVNATNSTENLDNKTETITGEKEVNANGSTENITNEKHVVAGSITEDITGDKHVNAANIVETVQGDKTVTAGDISETAENRTIHTTNDETRNTDGNSNETVTGYKNVEANYIKIDITKNFNKNVGGDMLETITNKKEIVSNELNLKPTEPLGYKTPSNLNEYFKCVPFKDNESGEAYNVLVEKEGADFDFNAGKWETYTHTTGIINANPETFPVLEASLHLNRKLGIMNISFIANTSVITGKPIDGNVNIFKLPFKIPANVAYGEYVVNMLTMYRADKEFSYFGHTGATIISDGNGNATWQAIMENYGTSGFNCVAIMGNATIYVGDWGIVDSPTLTSGWKLYNQDSGIINANPTVFPTFVSDIQVNQKLGLMNVSFIANTTLAEGTPLNGVVPVFKLPFKMAPNSTFGIYEANILDMYNGNDGKLFNYFAHTGCLLTSDDNGTVTWNALMENYGTDKFNCCAIVGNVTLPISEYNFIIEE